MREARPTARFWAGVAAIALYNGLVLAYLCGAAGSRATIVGVDDVASTIGPLLSVALMAAAAWRRRHRGQASVGGRPWAAALLVLAPVCWAISEGIVAYDQLTRGRSPGFPSWSNLAYAGAYACLILGILLLPRRPLPPITRLRILLDSVMVLVAVATCSWYFIGGPGLLQDGLTLAAGVVYVAYLLTYLALLVCVLLLLAARAAATIGRGAAACVAVGAIVIVAADSIYDYQNLHHRYVGGGAVDVLWPLGYMLIGLGASLVGRAAPRADADSAPADVAELGWSRATPPIVAPAVSLWPSLLPYALLPLVGALALVSAHDHANGLIQQGVDAGGAALIALVIVRQVVALRELHATYADNSLLSRANAQLEIMATTDPLTGLSNRSLLADRLARALRAPQPPALLLLDLDHFKEVNDTLGHHSGDLLLIQVGARLQAVLRASDTVARLGGDEFALLLPGTDSASAIAVARAVLAALDAPVLIEGRALVVGGSLGVAPVTDQAADAETLLRHADVAMYTAKRAGGGYALYDAAADDHSPARLALVADLRQAITTGALLLHYQPQVSLTTGRATGVEALVRWPHPDQGLIPPDRFIPLAERNGLMSALTHHVLETAIGQAAAWRRAGRPLSVAVNLSAATLRDVHLVDDLDALLRAHDLPAALLRVEVTESAMIADLARTRGVLEQCAARGMGVSVDDYGTGYSSLAYLKHLPVDELKIDQTFVRRLVADATDTAIVASTVGLGHSLGLRVVAEGVEDEETLRRLERMGCDSAQGYYLSRPLPVEDMDQWLAAHDAAGQQASA